MCTHEPMRVTSNVGHSLAGHVAFLRRGFSVFPCACAVSAYAVLRRTVAEYCEQQRQNARMQVTPTRTYVRPQRTVSAVPQHDVSTDEGWALACARILRERDLTDSVRQRAFQVLPLYRDRAPISAVGAALRDVRRSETDARDGRQLTYESPESRMFTHSADAKYRPTANDIRDELREIMEELFPDKHPLAAVRRWVARNGPQDTALLNLHGHTLEDIVEVLTVYAEEKRELVAIVGKSGPRMRNIKRSRAKMRDRTMRQRPVVTYTRDSSGKRTIVHVTIVGGNTYTLEEFFEYVRS